MLQAIFECVLSCEPRAARRLSPLINGHCVSAWTVPNAHACVANDQFTLVVGVRPDYIKKLCKQLTPKSTLLKSVGPSPSLPCQPFIIIMKNMLILTRYSGNFYVRVCTNASDFNPFDLCIYILCGQFLTWCLIRNFKKIYLIMKYSEKS